MEGIRERIKGVEDKDTKDIYPRLNFNGLLY
jgi:hypothetical protein